MTQRLLYPLYPLTCAPLLIWLGQRLPRPVARVVSMFSLISFEFYVLHGYLISGYFQRLFPGVGSVELQLPISFALTTAIAAVLALLARKTRGFLVASVRLSAPQMLCGPGADKNAAP